MYDSGDYLENHLYIQASERGVRQTEGQVRAWCFIDEDRDLVWYRRMPQLSYRHNNNVETTHTRESHDQNYRGHGMQPVLFVREHATSLWKLVRSCKAVGRRETGNHSRQEKALGRLKGLLPRGF